MPNLDLPAESPENNEENPEKDLPSDKWFEPKVVSTGCQDGHDFQYDYTDGEGRFHYQCSRCWQGCLTNERI